MGLFDAIKDALTTDDAERLEAAHKALDKAKTELDKVKAEVGTAADPASRGRLEKAEQGVAAAQTQVNELEAKVNHTPAAPEGSAEPVVDDATQQQAERDAEAGEGEMPYPPEYPKMEGEPLRVQPSRRAH